jgi:lysosomal alpha-mannosidase
VNGFAIESTSGRLTSAKICGIDLNLTQEFLYYTSSPQSSPAGAYIFKPDEITPNPLTTSPIKIKYKKGKLADEVLQTYATNEITQIIRVYKSEEHPYIEFDWLVGNLDTKKTGKEIATSFAMKNFCNDGTFTTDSNGREHIARDLSKRDGYSYKVEDSSVSGNYYPVTSDISINDKNRKITAIIMNDRAQGGSVSGLKDGTVELMIHRRLVTDDGIGIHEVLNEKEYNKGLYARGQHYFTFGYKDLHIRNGEYLYFTIY